MLGRAFSTGYCKIVVVCCCRCFILLRFARTYAVLRWAYKNPIVSRIKVRKTWPKSLDPSNPFIVWEVVPRRWRHLPQHRTISNFPFAVCMRVSTLRALIYSIFVFSALFFASLSFADKKDCMCLALGWSSLTCHTMWRKINRSEIAFDVEQYLSWESLYFRQEFYLDFIAKSTVVRKKRPCAETQTVALHKKRNERK